jgi:hypothetical protein
MLAATWKLDPTESAAERDRYQSELLAARLDGARLRAARGSLRRYELPTACLA